MKRILAASIVWLLLVVPLSFLSVWVVPVLKHRWADLGQRPSSAQRFLIAVGDFGGRYLILIIILVAVLSFGIALAIPQRSDRDSRD